MNTKIKLNKWKKIFESGKQIEFQFKGQERFGHRGWRILECWNLECFPEYTYKFRLRKMV